MRRLICRVLILTTHPLTIAAVLAFLCVKFLEAYSFAETTNEQWIGFGFFAFVGFLLTNPVYRKARNWSYRLRQEREWANALALEEALLMPLPPLPDPAPAPRVIIQPEPVIPRGPEMPAPSRVKVLVRQAPVAASPDEATMQRQLHPSLRELMQRSGGAEK